jgi:hypothetical protein
MKLIVDIVDTVIVTSGVIRQKLCSALQFICTNRDLIDPFCGLIKWHLNVSSPMKRIESAYNAPKN